MKNMTNAPPGINNEKEKILWQKIAGFKLDNPTAALPFSRKLALEHKWTYDFTLAAIEEYRKFIFLCCISPHGASPSKVIDEVWHLHLLYTENYWEEFCEKTLQRKLHHRPGGGGTEQKQKHHFWHLDTLEQYRNIFNQDPLFVDQSKGDFHLKDGSPAINAGIQTGGINTDLDGVTRPNPPATAPAIGCYEFKP